MALALRLCAPASAVAASQLAIPMRVCNPICNVPFPAPTLPAPFRTLSWHSASPAQAAAAAAADGAPSPAPKAAAAVDTGAQYQSQVQLQTQTQQQQQLQQQQQQQRQLRSRPRSRALTNGPAFSDLLGPWFPADRTLRQMLSTMDRMFDDVIGVGVGVGPTLPSTRPSWGLKTAPTSAPAPAASLRAPWDAQETQEAYHLRFDLPGLGKEEVQVQVSPEGVLSIRAQHKDEEAQGDVWRRRLNTNYQTSVQLPEDIHKAGITAEMKHGVLTVMVPKRQEERSQSMQIPVA